jgi:hypothetical protein
MSNILHFSLERPRRTRPEATQEGPMGQILFFTGVRFERHAEDDDSQRGGAAVQGRRRRKA